MADSPSSTGGAGRGYPIDKRPAPEAFLARKVETLESELLASRERTRVLEEALPTKEDVEALRVATLGARHQSGVVEALQKLFSLAAVAVEDEGNADTDRWLLTCPECGWQMAPLDESSEGSPLPGGTP